jgi:hypothetical protein
MENDTIVEGMSLLRSLWVLPFINGKEPCEICYVGCRAGKRLKMLGFFFILCKIAF